MDFGGRPRGLEAEVEAEAVLISPPASARIAGVVSADFAGRPRFFGIAGVEGPTVDEREIFATSRDVIGLRLAGAGVGAPTVEEREMLASF